MSVTIEDVVDAHQAVIDVQQLMEELAGERNVLVRAALASSVSVGELAGALGVSRARVYAMAARRDTPGA